MAAEDHGADALRYMTMVPPRPDLRSRGRRILDAVVAALTGEPLIELRAERRSARLGFDFRLTLTSWLVGVQWHHDDEQTSVWVQLPLVVVEFWRTRP